MSSHKEDLLSQMIEDLHLGENYTEREVTEKYEEWVSLISSI